MIDGECRRGLEQLLHLLSHVLNVNGRAHNLAGSGDRAFMQFSLQHDHAGGGAGELRNLLFVFFAPGRVATSTASGLPIRGFTLYHASESAAMDADAIRAALGR